MGTFDATLKDIERECCVGGHLGTQIPCDVKLYMQSVIIIDLFENSIQKAIFMGIRVYRYGGAILPHKNKSP